MFLLLISLGPIPIQGDVEFNNVLCLVRDRKFMDFEYCYLKSVNRTYKYLSVKTKFHHFPIDNGEVRFQLTRRENGRVLYKFDFKVDACKFLRDRQNVVANLAFQTFEHYSNMNHTCPYDHDIIVDKLPVQHVNGVVQAIIPDGRYLSNSTFRVGGIPRLDILVYFSKS
ncbi:uncharacterized protein LOC108047934 [Drosophila rhopaloa]|uniref:Uncharacterized protein LOC108047934 n=1 Tax=Drosophila rhopaloa TaxID=1041015 RepID=A0A6P4F0B1_DRORH|nr:uncharacterized protein LOC108047934 [Drosophila rhopaloa]